MNTEFILDKSNKVFKRYKNVLQSNDDALLCLNQLSKINIFIGPNNSGKSWFLRELFSSMHFKDLSSDRYNDDGYIEKFKIFNNLDFPLLDSKKIKGLFIPKYLQLTGIPIENEIREKIAEVSKYLTKEQLTILELNNILKVLLNISEKYPLTPYNTSINYQSPTPLDLKKEEVIREFDGVKKRFITIVLEELGKISYKTTYIPPLRSIKNLGGSLFANKAFSDWFSNSNSPQQLKENIFTGEDMYKSIDDLRRGGEEEKDLLDKFEQFLGKSFFNGNKVYLNPKKYSEKSTLENRYDNFDLYVKIGKETEFPIYNLGDGIQSIIILMFALFIKKNDPHIIFIEEPELYLHPGFQRIFIETINSTIFENTQIFIATHSNHFLDMTIEFNSNISVFKFNKIIENSNFQIENITCPDSSLLELLGVKNSSLFLTNCTIWIEGITDRLYFKRFLAIYQKAKALNDQNFKIYQEDIHYSFVEYAGANITHWSFIDEPNSLTETETMNVERLCGKLFLITDNFKVGLSSQGKLPAKGSALNERHQRLKKNLGERYYKLKCCEVENLLLPKIIIETVKIFEKNSGNANPKISQFEYSDYIDKPLGSFLDKNVLNKKIKTYKANNGAILYKNEFCNRALNFIESLDDLSPEVITICETLYAFIKINNI